jgi:4'-phosphopantetheinyl transferase
MSDHQAWELNPESVDLGENQIHIWRAYLDCAEAVLRQFEATLAPDEKARSLRFIFQRDRDSFVAARGILRELLGRYLSRSPADLEFDYRPEGKPFLRKQFDQSVHFNLSHSHGLALVGFARGRELGVDVELVRPDVSGDEIATRFFSPEEVAELRAFPASLRSQGFFLCWTLKEAYIKARGGGLNIPLDSFHVSFTPGQPERLRSEDSSRWSLCSFRPDPRYVGALVAEGTDWQPRYWDWQPQDRK